MQALKNARFRVRNLEARTEALTADLEAASADVQRLRKAVDLRGHVAVEARDQLRLLLDERTQESPRHHTRVPRDSWTAGAAGSGGPGTRGSGYSPGTNTRRGGEAGEAGEAGSRGMRSQSSSNGGIEGWERHGGEKGGRVSVEGGGHLHSMSSFHSGTETDMASVSSVLNQVLQARAIMGVSQGNRLYGHDSPMGGPGGGVGGEGDAAGVGVSFLQEQDGNIIAAHLAANGAASRDGRIQAGDILCAVNNEDIIGQCIDVVRSKITGPAGAAVHLTLARMVQDPGSAGNELPPGYTIHRDDILGCFASFRVSLTRDAVPQRGGGSADRGRRGAGGRSREGGGGQAQNAVTESRF
jgi:hypothetical protein